MLSVLRKPVEIYVGSTLTLVKADSRCWQFDRSPTLPLEDALSGLNDSLAQLRLGFCRRAYFFLGSALCPPAETDPTMPPPMLPRLSDTIEHWSLEVGLLAIQIRPLWSVCTELACVNSDDVSGIRLIEPDAVTLLPQTPDRVDPEHTLQVQFQTTPGNSAVLSRHWAGHWEKA